MITGDPVRRSDVHIEEGGRIFRGLATPYDQSYTVRDPTAGVIQEVWDGDSYRELPRGIPLLLSHFRATVPIGVVRESWVAQAGLFVEGELLGSESEIDGWRRRWAAGVYSGLSVGFRHSGRQVFARSAVSGQPPLLLRRGCLIEEISITSWPAFSKAGVMSVRRKSMQADDAERELIEAEHYLGELDKWRDKRKATG